MNQKPFLKRVLRPIPMVVALAVVVVVVIGARLMTRHRGDDFQIPLEAISLRDISQTVEATGTVEPVEIVEIRSKASGQILRMPVQVGSVVRAGDLLAQVDTVNVQNQYDEAVASLQAARANAQITKAQKERADELFKQSVMTADQHESAVLAYANAQSQLVNASSNLEIAKQALADAKVRAPSNGTIIEQDVTKGQVIASATMSASGGTLMLKMADLKQVQMQALVGETDIGNVRSGMPATVTVDAFPNRPFPGVVQKIEPQAVVQQSVTMFPVLVSISNEQGLLLPGMNGEVSISIAEATQVPAVSLDAVRSMRELPTVAVALGLDADSLQAQVKREVAALRASRDSMMRARGGSGGWGGGQGGQGMMAQGAGMQGAPGMRGGQGGAGGRQQWMARAGAGQGQGQGQWSGRSGMGGRSWPGRGDSTRSGGAWRQGGAGDGAGSNGSGSGNGNGRSVQVAFVSTPNGLEPRVVRLGVSDFDYAQVLSGLKVGDQVALVSVAEIQAKRQQDQNRIRQRMGGAMPGMTGGGRAAGGGGGGRAAGGGGR